MNGKILTLVFMGLHFMMHNRILATNKDTAIDFVKCKCFDAPIYCWGMNIDIIKNFHGYYEPNYECINVNKFASFNGSTFKDTCCFSKFSFDTSVEFVESTFSSIAVFKKTNFHQVDYTKATFKKYCKFGNSNFQNITNFTEAQFQSVADFSYASFSNTTYFRYARFDTLLDLSILGIVSSTKFDFFQAHLPFLIDFSSNVGLQNTVDFTCANFEDYPPKEAPKYHFINLYKSDISKILIDYEHFRLCFYDNQNDDPIIMGMLKDYKTPYSDSVIDFLSKSPVFAKYIGQVFPFQNTSAVAVTSFINYSKQFKFPRRLSFDETRSIYELVLKNFESNGQKESYKSLDIEYNDRKYGSGSIQHRWNCYGYHKEYVFIWSLFFISIFTLITFFCLDRLNGEQLNKYHNNDKRGAARKGNFSAHKAVYNIEGIPYLPPLPQIILNNEVREIGRRLWYSFIYSSTIFFLLKIKLENLNFQRVGILYIIIIYTAGIINIAYIANFVFNK